MRSRVLAVLVVMASLLAPVYAGTLAVPLIGQEKDNWCWNASSNMVLQFYGFTHTQTEVAASAVGGYNVPNHLSSTTVGPLAAPAGTPAPAANYNRKGCGLVLTEFGPVNSDYLSRSLTYDEIKTAIDDNCPAILLVRWIDAGTDTGGHIIVLRGYDETGEKISLNDPWPASNDPCVGCAGVAYIVAYSRMFDVNGPNTYSGSAALGNNWTRTLKTTKVLDLCFLIDSTGSMGPYIESVKAASLAIIDKLTANGAKNRFAVVDYRDNPACSYCAASDDWITLVRSPFTEDANAAKDAINAIYSGGGADIPEAVFSALMFTMQDTIGLGGWRKDAERHIILMGDAPGHDPEPWAGGYSQADVLAYCAADPNKKSIDALLTGGGSDVSTEFGGFAAATGGTVRNASDSNAGEEMADIVSTLVEATPRSPLHSVESLKPLFTFTPTTDSMGPAVKNILLEIQKLNVNAKDPNKSTWKKFMLVTLAGDANSWTPLKPLPKGDYRWRTGYVRGAGVFALPSGTTTKIKAAKLMEVEWTAFTRAEIEATAPAMYSPTTNPYTSFTATDKEQDYTFGTVAGASGYGLGISTYKESKTGGAWKVWKKVTVKPPADANATTVTVTVKGHTVGTAYEWSVQSLNFDHPKPVWTPLP